MNQYFLKEFASPGKARWLKNLFVAVVGVCVLSPEAGAVELMVDVDVFDNLARPGYYDVDVYGPEQVEALFAACRKAGVARVYWRSQCQIASYPSGLNYSGADQEMIRSRPDVRHRGDGLSAKVGVAEEGGGIFQGVDTVKGKQYRFGAWVSGSTNSAVCLRIFDRETNELIAQSPLASDSAFQELAVKFVAKGPVRVGVVSLVKSGKMDVYVVDEVSLAAGGGKNLIANGEMTDVFMLVPKAWDAGSANFLVLNGDVFSLPEEDRKAIFPKADYFMGLKDYYAESQQNVKNAMDRYDPLKVAVEKAHENGIELYAWFDPVDDGRRFLPSIDSWWVSRFHEDHPRFRLVDRNGVRRWGQLCFGYPEVRVYKTAVVEELMGYGVDGIYIKTGWQHNMIWDGGKYDYSQFVYNDVALAEYEQRWGKPADGEYDLGKLKKVHGDFFGEWLWEASQVVHSAGKKLAFSMRPGNSLEEMLGSWDFAWRPLIEEKLVDEFMVEPRIFNRQIDGNRDYLESLERQFGYARLCREHGVRFGYDYYLTRLMMNVHEDQQDVLVSQVLSLAGGALDFVGIYEEMHIAQFDSWPAIERIGKELPGIPRWELPDSGEDDVSNSRKNLLREEGVATVVVRGKGFEKDASGIKDGNIGELGSIYLPGVPCEVEIGFSGPKPVKAIRIYSGAVSCAWNSSGDCGIRAFRVQGKPAGGEWVDLCEPVKDLPLMRDTDAPTECDFFHEQELVSDQPVVAMRVIVDESNDTGRRNDGSVVPEDRRVVYIREIEVY